MAASVTEGTLTLQLADLHSDVLATATTSNAIDSYTEFEEYGREIGAAGNRYGSLGSLQRSREALGGLTLMGVRLYNPVTGMFMSPDPIPGGNITPYVYPQDPINSLDPSGQICVLHRGNCSFDFHRITGSVVHMTSGIRDKLKSKHNITNINLISYVVFYAHYHSLHWLKPGSRAPYYSVYRLVLRRVIVTLAGPRETGDWVEFVVWINWFDGKKNHGDLRTMFCNNMKRCPDWVNRVQL
jgi:RHS repeat-associated protein